MKISKLFHWLYAFLMFLPIFAIAVKCGYVMFNKNAKDSYLGSYHYSTSISLGALISQNGGLTSYTTNNVTNYYFSNNNLYSDISFSLSSGYQERFSAWAFNTSSLIVGSRSYSCSCFTFAVNNSNLYNEREFKLYDFTFNTNYYLVRGTNGTIDLYNSTGVLMTPTRTLTSSRYDTLTFNFTNFGDIYSLSNDSRSTFYNYSSLNVFFVDGSLSSVFYSALQELDSVEFFSWAKNSFLAEPFMYIGNLFGIPNVHPIFTFLSYWMAISVIWLVFDVFMYVPLLAHKWIDKGKVD